jgi:AcrR family transcriptional regulator
MPDPGVENSDVAGRRHTVVPSGASGPRDRILRAAADLFGRDGVRATSVDALIESAGVARATFYRYFSSKDQLVAAWLDARALTWLELVRRQVTAQASDPAEQLTLFFDVLAAHVAKPEFRGCAHLNTAAELRDPPDETRRALRAYFAALEEHLRSNVQAAGFGDPVRTAAQLRVVACGMLALTLAIGDGSPGRDGADLVAALVERQRRSPDGP